MKNRKAVIVLFCLLLAGCSANSGALKTSANAVDKLAIANRGFQIGAQDAKQAGFISAQEDIQLQQIVIRIAQTNDKLAQAIQDGNNGNGNWKAEADAAIKLVSDLNAQSLLFVKNDTKRAELQAIVAGIQVIFDTVSQEVK